MPVSVTVTGDKIPEKLVTPQLLRELGDLAIRRIRTRTERGVDVRGAAFKPLSPGYAKQKAAAGLPPVANLQVSGAMLNDMTVVSVSDHTVSLGFVGGGSGSAIARAVTRKGKKLAGVPGGTFIQRSRAVGSADKAFYHTEAGAGRSQVIREFFALNDEDERVLEAALDLYFDGLTGK